MHRVKEEMGVYQRERTGIVHTAQETHKKSKHLCKLSNNGPKGEAGMSGSELIKNEEIQNRIYTIRGVQVMLDIKEFKNSHDRFIIIDNTTVYHFGASLKDIGKKWFAFSKMDFWAVEMLTRLEGMKIDE